MQKIVIDGVEMDLPFGVEPLGEDDIYSVPFEQLSLAEVIPDEEYTKLSECVFCNPRYGNKKEKTDAKGFAKEEMNALYTDIKEDGLLITPVCRWIQKDGVVGIQIIEGERRRTVIGQMIAKNDMVFSRKNQCKLPASEVHKRVSCRIVSGSALYALKVAFMLEDRKSSWSEEAKATLVKRLRQFGQTDKEILTLTRKSDQWLREEDKIGQLDDLTVEYYDNTAINRASALKLFNIKELDRRHRYLHKLYDIAVNEFEERVQQQEAAIEKAEDRVEILEAELDLAVDKNDEAKVEEVKQKLEEAHEKTEEKRKRRQQTTRPQGKLKHFRQAAAAIAEESPEEAEKEDAHAALRQGKMRAYLDRINQLIETNGKKDGQPYLPVDGLWVTYNVLKAILHGDDDIDKVLNKTHTALKLKNYQKPVEV